MKKGKAGSRLRPAIGRVFIHVSQQVPSNDFGILLRN